MKQMAKKLLRPAIFVGVGALAGLVYYHFFGCGSSCGIASSAVRSMVYMGFVGYLMSVVFGKGCGGCNM